MGKLLEKLREGKVLLSDGAWGTMLQARGLKPGTCPELWNVERRVDVLEVARAYVSAGSDMIETNSFGGSCFKLEHYGLGNRVNELNRAAAEISREAAGNRCLVLGSVGPTGKILMTAEVSEQEMYDAFREQIMALAEGGCDAIVVETMSDLEEARLAIRAARESTALDVICTMTFEKTMDGSYRTMMGVAPWDMIPGLVEAGAQVLGSNCGNGTAGMIDIAREIRKADPDIPLLIQGNAGTPVYQEGRTVFNETPEVTAGFVPGLLQSGVNIIGGCCGTTPDHIRRMREEIRS